MKVLALDFGGSSVKYGIVNEKAALSEVGRAPAPLTSQEDFLNTVAEIYDRFRGEVCGIGISLPGSIDPESGILFGSGVYRPMYGQNIPYLIRERCGALASVENDGKRGVLSEAWNGALKDCRSGMVLVLGSGIAGGLMADGKVYSGKAFNAGEFSYAVTHPGDYTLLSCAFMQAGMLGVTYKLCKMKNLDFSVQDASPILAYLDSCLASQFPVPDGNPKKIRADGRQFFNWVNQGDPDAVSIYADFRRALGAMVFNAKICFAPQRIVISGGISHQPQVIPDLLEELEKYDRGFGLDERWKAEIVCSPYQGEANLCGAAYHFMRRYGRPGEI